MVFGSSQPDDVWFQRGAQREIDWCLDLVNQTMYGFNAELSVRSTVVFGSSQPDDVWFQRGAQREIDNGVWIYSTRRCMVSTRSSA